MPFLFLSYVVAYLDRVNIGFAARDMQADLGLSAQVYGTGAGLFFLGYFLFEIPSNLILERVGARRWIARIMIGWGVVSMAMMFVEGRDELLRHAHRARARRGRLLPGRDSVPHLLDSRAGPGKTGALFMIAAPVAMLIGAPISGLLLELDGWLGLHGWQWLFLVEGLPACVLGVMALIWLTDRPEQATWLPADDRPGSSGNWRASGRRDRHRPRARVRESRERQGAGC